MWKKPLPNIDLDNKSLYQEYKQHNFALYRCQDCGDWYFPKSFCRNHENESYFGNIKLEESSGSGAIFAIATTRRLFHPGFEDDLPYTFAMIELEEGPLFGSQIIGINPDDVEIGLPVEVRFQDVEKEEIPEEKRENLPLGDGFSLPYFAPTDGGEAQ